MQPTTLKFPTLRYRDTKTYLIAPIFILGNILLPQLIHHIPNGGLTLLPIYFFTLIAAYKYGWKVGLLTAILSPTINYLMFGMPSTAALTVIILKSSLLALTAGIASKHFQRLSVSILMGVVLTYQTLGALGAWIIEGSLLAAIQDFHMAIPGILLQVFGGYLVLKSLEKID